MDPLWSETCRSTFKYFIILIVSANHILCIGWIIKCLSLMHGANMKTVLTVYTLLLTDWLSADFSGCLLSKDKSRERFNIIVSKKYVFVKL